MHRNDNVATSVSDILPKTNMKIKVNEVLKEISIVERIPFGHKFAIAQICKGEDIIKYGEIIGEAIEEIGIGELVHIHNVKSKRGFRGSIIKR